MLGQFLRCDAGNRCVYAIYAAALSTIVFIWRLYEFWDDRRGKIIVSLGVRSQVPVYYNNTLGQWEEIFVITAVNRGKEKRMIERPGGEVDRTTEKSKYLSLLNMEDKTKYPLALEPGQKFEYTMPFHPISELKITVTKKIRAIVQDTHGETYRSKWYKL